jgi:hypothetical protein
MDSSFSGQLRDHEVEEDQVGGAVARLAEGLGAVGRLEDLVAFLGEVVPDQHRDVGLVLDHEDPARLPPGRDGAAATVRPARLPQALQALHHRT